MNRFHVLPDKQVQSDNWRKCEDDNCIRIDSKKKKKEFVQAWNVCWKQARAKMWAFIKDKHKKEKTIILRMLALMTLTLHPGRCFKTRSVSLCVLTATKPARGVLTGLSTLSWRLLCWTLLFAIVRLMSLPAHLMSRGLPQSHVSLEPAWHCAPRQKRIHPRHWMPSCSPALPACGAVAVPSLHPFIHSSLLPSRFTHAPWQSSSTSTTTTSTSTSGPTVSPLLLMALCQRSRRFAHSGTRALPSLPDSLLSCYMLQSRKDACKQDEAHTPGRWPLSMTLETTMT